MDELEKRMLKEVAELDSLPVGAFNIRSNGKSEGRCSTANIQIESRESGDGINVYFKDGTKNESCHIPVIISKSGHKECVYNDFFIGSDCDVVIVAGCGISNCGGQPARRHPYFPCRKEFEGKVHRETLRRGHRHGQEAHEPHNGCLS